MKEQGGVLNLADLKRCIDCKNRLYVGEYRNVDLFRCSDNQVGLMSLNDLQMGIDCARFKNEV